MRGVVDLGDWALLDNKVWVDIHEDVVHVAICVDLLYGLGHGRIRHNRIRHSWIKHSWIRHSWIRYSWISHSWIGSDHGIQNLFF